MPPGLEPYLRRNFTFARPRYTIDWENFMAADGSPSAGNGVMQVGLTVTSSSEPDPRPRALGARGAPFFVVGNTLTYIIRAERGDVAAASSATRSATTEWRASRQSRGPSPSARLVALFSR